MDKVVRSINEDRSVARAEWDTCSNRSCPVYRFGHASPGEPKLPDGSKACRDANYRHHCLRRRFAGLGIWLVRIDHAAYERLEGNDGHGPDSDADERQTRHCNRPATDAGEDDGVRHEAKVQNPYDHVSSQVRM